MYFKIVLVLSFILFTVSLLAQEACAFNYRGRQYSPPVQTKSKDDTGNEEYENSEDVSKLISPKYQRRIENAIKRELKDHKYDPSILTPVKLDQLVEEHNKNVPWFKRLWSGFKDVVPQIIQAIARKILEDVVVPAIRQQLDKSLG